MGDRLGDFIRALEAAAGRQPWPDDVDPELRVQAGRLLASAHAVGRESKVPKSFARKALRVFGRSRAPSRARLVFDSWFEPALAVRHAGPVDSRFLRYEGPLRLELQTRDTGRGVELLGQIDPPDVAAEVILEWDGKDRRVAVDSVGSFRMARLRHGVARLRIGDTTIEDIPL